MKIIKVFKRVTKDPDAIKTYTLDWADGGPNDGTPDDLGWLQADTILTSTWIVDSELTIAAESNTTTTASVKLAGGVLGRKHYATNRITTTVSSETEDRTLEIRIIET